MIFARNIHGRGLLPLILAYIVEFDRIELICELDGALASTHENVSVVVGAEGREATRRRWGLHDSLDWASRADR